MRYFWKVILAVKNTKLGEGTEEALSYVIKKVLWR